MQMLVTIEQQDKTKPNNGLIAKISAFLLIWSKEELDSNSSKKLTQELM
jgi:hypothetical protein